MSPSPLQTASIESTVAPPRENRQALYQNFLTRCEKVIAPVDCVTQCLLTLRKVACAPTQPLESLPESHQHGLRRQELASCGR